MNEFPRQPRRRERDGWTEPTRVAQLENDLDQNDREHANFERHLADAIKSVEEEFSRRINELQSKVDRLTWALATAAVSFAVMAASVVIFHH